jgi:hypothetical protein
MSMAMTPLWSQYGLVGDNISELALGRYGRWSVCFPAAVTSTSTQRLRAG